MEKFNENLSQFTNIIKNLYPEQKDAIEITEDSQQEQIMKALNKAI